MTNILYTAFISPELHARLQAIQSQPMQPRRTAAQRRAATADRQLARRLVQERAAREAAFQKRVDAISDEIYVAFQPCERCELPTAPILTDDQRRAYALQAAGKQARKQLKRDLKEERRRQRAGEWQ